MADGGLTFSRYHRNRQSVGVGSWTTVNWLSSLVEKVDTGSLDNGSQVVDGAGAVLQLKHKAGTSQLGTGGGPRTGIAWAYPIDMPIPVDFNRHRVLLRAQVAVPGGLGVGSSVAMILTPDLSPVFSGNFLYAGASREVEAGGTKGYVTDSSGAQVGNPGTGNFLEFQLLGRGPGSANERAPGIFAAWFSTTGFASADRAVGVGSTAPRVVNLNAWGSSGMKRLWVALWLHTKGQAVGAFTITVTRARYRVVDFYPET